jgi:replicative DNA helicase
MKQKSKKESFVLTPDMAGRVMPQSVPSERYVIGSILLSGQSALEQVVGILSDEMFYGNANAILYKAFTDMQTEAMAIDMISVCEWLLKTGNLNDCGGPAYISQLTGNIASDSHIVAHAEIVKEKYLRRKIIIASAEAYHRGFDETEDVDRLVALYESDIQGVQELMMGRRDTSHISAIIAKAIKELYRRTGEKRMGHDVGITTGFADLNHKLSGGWTEPDFIVLAARPSVGKTALALHMAERAALNNTPVLLVSLEMNEVQIINRMIIGKSGVDSYAYKAGLLGDDDLTIAENTAFSRIAGLPICVEDNPDQTVVSILSKARVLKKQGKCNLLIIDYLQLITAIPGQNREQEVAGISRALKLGAKRLHIPVIVLSQQNRKGGSDLATLRESGAIEQDADVVIFIERNSDEIEMEDRNGNPVDNLIRLNIKKNRNGETGVVFITHNSSFTAFYDYDRQVRKVMSASEYADPNEFHESEGDDDKPF